MFTIEEDGFADISNAVMYILLPDGVNRYGDENMRKSFSHKSVGVVALTLSNYEG